MFHLPPVRARRTAVVLMVTALVAVADLASKRWAEDALADSEHLIPIEAVSPPAGTTAGDVVRARFPDLDDAALDGNLLRLARDPRPDADTRVFDAAGPFRDAAGFVVFDRGDLSGFARRLDRYEVLGIERWVRMARPDLPFPEVRRRVREHLTNITLADWIGRRVPFLAGEDARITAETGTFVLPRDEGRVAPTDPAVAGQVYLVADRKIVVIPDHFDFSYVENPAGAWGLLDRVDPGLRGVLFRVLGLLAILAVVVLAVRPPVIRLPGLVALGAVLGGALGNAWDRLATIYVVDFIHWYWGSWHWPRFNIADVGISVGIVALLLALRREQAPAPDRPADPGSESATRMQNSL